MKAIAVGSMRPKAAGSGERTSLGVRSGSVRLGIIRYRVYTVDFYNVDLNRLVILIFYYLTLNVLTFYRVDFLLIRLLYRQLLSH